MRRTAFLFCSLALATCHGFSASNSRRYGAVNRHVSKPLDVRTTVTNARSSTRLSALHGSEHEVLTQALQSLDADQLHHALLSVSTSLADAADAAAISLTDAADALSIPDAADAVAEVAEEASNDGGWWASYLNVFKNALDLIHSTVDEPLRNAGITQTWGVSIALFTICARSLLIPLSVQQTKSAEYIKVLKPYVQEIKKKFKDNKDTQNQAIAKLYEDAKQNPLSGCLLSLAQLPLLLGLYRGIRLLAQDGKLDEPFLWIPSLEGPVTAETDYRGLTWLTEGWTQVDGSWIPSLGWETTLAFLVMPVLLVIGQSLTMSVLQPPIDDNMEDEERETLEKTQRILKFLPLMIGFFSLQVPAGLTIYWFTTNLFTLTQSLAVRSYYAANPPEVELPDYWDALDDLETMTAEEKRAAAEAGLSVGPKYSDLLDEAKFHIVVERAPLRKGNAAWKRVEDAGAEGLTIPQEFLGWAEPPKAKIENKTEAAIPASA